MKPSRCLRPTFALAGTELSSAPIPLADTTAAAATLPPRTLRRVSLAGGDLTERGIVRSVADGVVVDVIRSCVLCCVVRENFPACWDAVFAIA